MILLASLAVGLAPQSAQDAGNEVAWRLVDGVAAQAGDAVIRFGYLDSRTEARRAREGRTLSTPAELDAYLAETLDGLVQIELEVQAGEDLGVAADQIERAARRLVEDQRQEKGAVDLAAALEEEGLSSLDAAESNRAELHRYAWLGTVRGTLGRENLTGRRPTRDRFVRPGELRAIYDVNRDDLGKPVVVQFQLMVFLAEASGGLEAARTLAADYRERALEGEDFGLLMSESSGGRQPVDFLSDPLEVDGLATEIQGFARAGQVGDVSEVIPLLDRQSTREIGYRVLRIAIKEEGAPPPPFSDARLQERLRELFTRRRDEEWLAGARAELRRASPIWIDPRFQAQRPTPEPAPTAPQR
jgi:hypothetical protein